MLAEVKEAEKKMKEARDAKKKAIADGARDRLNLELSKESDPFKPIEKDRIELYMIIGVCGGVVLLCLITVIIFGGAFVPVVKKRTASTERKSRTMASAEA